MKKSFFKNIRWNRYYIYSFIYLIFTLIFSYATYSSYDNSASNVFSVLLAFAALFAGAFLTSIFNITLYQCDKFKNKISSLGFLDFLPNRDERNVYYNRIISCRARLDIMGHTAKRFLNDFADDSAHARDESKALLLLLARSVRVRMLLPSKDNLPEEKHYDFDLSRTKLEEIKSKFNSFDFKYYDHVPTHSIFCFDSECYLGPIFPKLESKHTPVIHMKTDSYFAQKYLNYFETEWDNAKS